MDFSGPVFKGDIGIEFVLSPGLDLSGYDVLQIKYIKPSGLVGTWSANLNADGDVAHTTTSVDDLDESGTWAIRIYVEIGGFKGHGESFKFTVRDPNKQE